jgi:hypothetical protein
MPHRIDQMDLNHQQVAEKPANFPVGDFSAM